MPNQFEVFLRTPYNYDTNKASDESGLRCKDKSLTVQSMAEEADINVILKRFGVTGQLPQGVRIPIYEDFEGVFDFHSAMNLIAEAREGFDRLPADVRAKFNNDPGQLVDFVSDPANADKLADIGLANPKATPEKVSPSPDTSRNDLGKEGDGAPSTTPA